ncbi:MAG: hypothetical protein MI864_17180 [Pseudomonadales bacterium]|nr:hypothetical protein [Pseudomonadales bacterium]
MEPFEWIIGLALLLGGYEILTDEKQDEPIVSNAVKEQSIVSDIPVFERGRYYRTGDGYFISNLTPALQKADGCDRPILTTDLTEPQIEDDHIQVTEVYIVCEG